MYILNERNDGAAGRDQGMRQAMSHAEAETPAWGDMAYDALKAFLDHHPNEYFFGENVREWASAQELLPDPPHARAWGGVIARGARSGLIVKHGIGQVSNPKAHKANAAIWRKAA
jgi:hypothetical protein